MCTALTFVSDIRRDIEQEREPRQPSKELNSEDLQYLPRHHPETSDQFPQTARKTSLMLLVRSSIELSFFYRPATDCDGGT